MAEASGEGIELCYTLKFAEAKSPAPVLQGCASVEDGVANITSVTSIYGRPVNRGPGN